MLVDCAAQMKGKTQRLNAIEVSDSSLSSAASLNSQSPLDETDLVILTLLQDDARLSFSEIGRRVHLSQPAVAERVHALEQAGIIKGYHAEVDSTRLGFPISAMVLVEARRVHETDAVVKLVKDLPDVLSCHKITGEYGLLLHVITSSLARLNQILQFISTYSPPTTSIILQSIFTRRTIRVAEK